MTASVNLNEYGIVLRVNLLQDVSSATALNFILQPKFGGQVLERSASDGVVVGTSNITVDDEQYLANQYLAYTLKDGDIDQSGQWRIQGQATLSSTNKVISDFKTITVLP